MLEVLQRVKRAVAERTRPWSPRRDSRLVRAIVPAIGLMISSGLLLAQTKSSTSVPDPLKGGTPNQKVVRQLNLLERAIDDVFIDSRAALVDRGRNTSAIYLPGQGAVIAVEFSVLEWDPDFVHVRHQGKNWDDDIVYYGYDWRDLDDIDDDDDDDDVPKMTRKEARERMKKLRAERYVKIKQELMSALAENADLISDIPGQEWITIMARPREESWGEEKITSLVLRVRRQDLTDRNQGKLSADDLFKKVSVEEYR